MILKFYKNDTGSVNGLDIIKFQKGKSYNFPTDLAEQNLQCGTCVEFCGEIPIDIIQSKNIKEINSNKIFNKDILVKKIKRLINNE